MEEAVARAEAGGEPISHGDIFRIRAFMYRADALFANQVPTARKLTGRPISSELSSAVVSSQDYVEVILSFMSLRQLRAAASTAKVWHQSVPAALQRWERVEHWQALQLWKTETGKAVIEHCLQSCTMRDHCAPRIVVSDETRASYFRILGAAIETPDAWPSPAWRLDDRVPSCIMKWCFAVRDTTEHSLSLEAAIAAILRLIAVKPLKKELLQVVLRPTLLPIADRRKCLANRYALEALVRVLKVLHKEFNFFNEKLLLKLLEHLEAMPHCARFLNARDDERVAVAVALIKACSLSPGWSAEANLVRVIEGVRHIPRPASQSLTDQMNEQLLSCLEQVPGSPVLLAQRSHKFATDTSTTTCIPFPIP